MLYFSTVVPKYQYFFLHLYFLIECFGVCEYVSVCLCRGCEESWALRPGEAQRFAWDDPAGVRKLCWSCQDHSGELDLVKVREGFWVNESTDRLMLLLMSISWYFL